MINMDIKKLKSKYEASRTGVPEVYSDREVYNASKLRASFTNDAPAMIIMKPKSRKNKESGKYERLTGKNGPVFERIAYIPIDIAGTKGVVVTALKPNVRLIQMIVDMDNPTLLYGESLDDPDRRVQYTATELIEGTLRFVPQPQKYADGKVYDVPVLDIDD